jgi:hypothetical protein
MQKRYNENYDIQWDKIIFFIIEFFLAFTFNLFI